MTKLGRYFLASLGPVATAGAQFILALLILRGLSPQAFGTFSFLLVAATLATSIWSALFCAPLLVVMTSNRPDDEEAAAAVLAASIVMTGIATLAFLAMALAMGLPLRVSTSFALFGSLGLVRWLGRAHAYAMDEQARTILSDVCYSAVLAAGTFLLLLLPAITLDHAYLVLLAATLVGIGALGKPYVAALLFSLSMRRLTAYRQIWRRYSSWSLAGVLSTEATMNTHAYLVTAITGPAAYAPIAATQLLIRPVTVATNALGEFVRALMARKLGEGRPDEAMHERTLLRIALIGITGAMALLAVGLLAFAPRLLFPAQYPIQLLAIGTASWLVVTLIRSLRAPESALLQAAGEFRPLAMASIYSAGVSIASVAIVLLLLPPIYSIVAITGGELIFLYLVWRKVRRWADGIAPEPRAIDLDEAPDGRPSAVSDDAGGSPPLPLTIGIKALNEEKHIAAALASAVAAAEALGGEVILADSGSTDRTLDIAGSFPVRIVQLANVTERCCGAGAQLAFQHARGEFFYLLDGDMELEPEFVPAGIAFLRENPSYAGVGGRVREMNVANAEFKMRAARVEADSGWQPGDVDRLDCGGLYRTAAIRHAGYFADRNLHAFEEFELAARLAAKGWKLARIDAPAVRHFGHTIEGYRLLIRRFRSGYSSASGEVLRAAIAKPHLPVVLRRLGHIRNGAIVLCWWIILLGLLVLRAPWWLTTVYALVPIAWLWWRRKSLELVPYSFLMWNSTALGLVTGLLRQRTSPALPLRSINISEPALAWDQYEGRVDGTPGQWT